MQLPDCCFGPRWPIGVDMRVSGTAIVLQMSDGVFPDKAVIWEVLIDSDSPSVGHFYFLMGYAEDINYSLAEFYNVPPILRGVSRQGHVNNLFECDTYFKIALRNLKIPVETQNKHLVVLLRNTDLIVVAFRVWITVSSIPTEVPDWMVSEKVRSLL